MSSAEIAGQGVDPCAYYAAQGSLSDPGELAGHLAGLPDDVADLCGIVQGLLIHDHFGGRLYGAPPADFETRSRATQPVALRLETIVADGPAPLSSARPPFERGVGTCRDFALLLCAFLRSRGMPARVRCGFADYFKPGLFEDHWVCEFWQTGEERWVLADAQLDEAHRHHLSIDFDVCDVPRERFQAPWKAWHLCRAGRAEPALFGHGDHRGAWFLQVNLVRDLLALRKQETSAWDQWRDARVRAVDQRLCESVADLTKAIDRPSSPVPALPDMKVLSEPPW